MHAQIASSSLAGLLYMSWVDFRSMATGLLQAEMWYTGQKQREVEQTCRKIDTEVLMM